MDDHFEAWCLSLRDAGFQPDDTNTSWSGTVAVEWDEPITGEHQSAEHHVLIELPEGFPYNAPIVISRDNPPLQRSWHMEAGERATLCLWDKERDWDPSFSARKLLRRIADWFYYYHTDSWPENSQIPDLHRYLERIGMVMLGEDWEPPAGEDTGQFKLWYTPKHRSTFPDVAATDLTQEKPEARIAENIVLGDRTEMQGVWFRIPEPFVPPNRLDELLTLIDRLSGKSSGWAYSQLKANYGLKTYGDGLAIAIGYHDTQENERWLFLWAEFPDKEGKRYRWTAREKMSQVVVKSLQAAPAGKEDLLRRSAHVSQHLTGKRATVFGVGALGSSIALLLAKSGLGHLRLIDRDILVPGNAMRHECDLRYVGFEKTKALKRIIKRHNPDCIVECFDAAWKRTTLELYLADSDIVVDATGNTNFSLYLNEICVEGAQPIVFSAAYRRASVGRLLMRTGDTDPCLSCYLECPSAWSEEEYPRIPENPNEGFVEDGCGNVTEEAVALDVEAIANFTARRVVKLLRDEHDGSNLAITINKPLPEGHRVLTEPGAYYYTNIARLGCRVCGQ